MKGHPVNHSEAMDRIYHFQRHFYDASRPLFLFGRDALLEKLDIGEGACVLEMGCGTARNLLCLAKKYPTGRFFGLDASEEMLKVARRKIGRANFGDRIRVKRAYAEELDHLQIFGLESKFDRIFFSYSLSMMPSWKAALNAAFLNLAPDGSLFVVDFYNQAGWPKPLRAAFRKWLSLFKVQFNSEMIAGLESQYMRMGKKIEIVSIGFGYAFLAGPRP